MLSETVEVRDSVPPEGVTDCESVMVMEVLLDTEAVPTETDVVAVSGNVCVAVAARDSVSVMGRDIV